MSRVLSLYLPTWPTDRLRRKHGADAPSSEVPLALVGMNGRRREIVAADAAAISAGIRVGMPAAKAQILLPGLAVQVHDTISDVIALEKIAVWMMQRFSPIVAPDPPDGIVLDTTGADHLHGGEGKMLDLMIDRLRLTGIAARGAIADTWGAAHALARYGGQRTTICLPNEQETALEGLPVSALRLPSDIVDQLQTLGFERIGELVAVPREPLTLRFGPEIGRRLDQSLGDLAEPIDAIGPPGLIEVSRSFGDPIGAPETIARYVSKLVASIIGDLEAAGVGACRLDLLCHRVDNRIEVVRVGLAVPSRDEKRLTRLLCDQIERIDAGFGIEVMRLRATATEPIVAKQMVSSLIEEPMPDISDLIDIISNREDRDLYRMAPMSSDVPERSVVRIAAMAPETGATWPNNWPRPSRLLPRPEPIETVALLPDHPPATFTWRGVRRRVRRADGPERVFGEWWKRDAELTTVRDYFQVEDDAGERYWIFRAGDGEDPTTGSHRWFLHGVFG